MSIINHNRPAPQTNQNPEQYTVPPQHDDDKSNRTERKPSRRGLLIGGLAAATALVGGGGYVAGKALGSKKEAAPVPLPEAKPTTPAETTPAAPEMIYGIELGLEGEELRKAFEIPAGLSDEEYARTFTDRLSAWSNYGCTNEWLARFDDLSVGVDQKEQDALAFGDQASEYIAQGLFGDNWQENDLSSIRVAVEHMSNVCARNMLLYAKTISGTYDQDKEAFESHMEFISYENRNDGIAPDKKDRIERLLYADIVEINNADQNRARELVQDPTIFPSEGNRYSLMLGEQDQDGVSVTTSYSITDADALSSSN